MLRHPGPAVLVVVVLALCGCTLADPAGGSDSGKDIGATDLAFDPGQADAVALDVVDADDPDDAATADPGTTILDVAPLACTSPLTPAWTGLLAGARAEAMAVDGTGNLYVAGTYDTLQVGGEVVEAADQFDAFVIGLDASGGVRWVRTLGSTGLSGAHGIGVDAAGNVYVIGEFQGSVAGPVPLASAGGTDVFVVRYDPEGTVDWAHAYGSTGLDWGNDVSVGPDGPVITGSFDAQIDFGKGAVTPDGPSSHASGGQFLAALTTDGAQRWAWGFPHLGTWSMRVAARADGGAVLGGQCRTASAWVGGEEVDCGASGAPFVAGYSADGTNVWFSRWPGAGYGAVTDLSVASDGSIAAIGAFSGSLDLGAGLMTAADQQEQFVMRLDADGKRLASRALGFAVTEGAHGVAALFGGRVAVTGGVVTRALGPGAAAPAGYSDLFVMAFGADLGCGAVLRYGTAHSDIGRALAVGPAGQVAVTGSVNAVDSAVLVIDEIP